jgi:hypothetical protein
MNSTSGLKALGCAFAALSATLALASPNAQATADDYFDCLKGRNININLSPVYPNFMLNVGKRAAQIMNDQGLSADAVSGGLVEQGMSPHLAGAIVACSPKIGPVAPTETTSGSTCDGAGCVPNVTQTLLRMGPAFPRAGTTSGWIPAVNPMCVCPLVPGPRPHRW